MLPNKLQYQLVKCYLLKFVVHNEQFYSFEIAIYLAVSWTFTQYLYTIFFLFPLNVWQRIICLILSAYARQSILCLIKTDFILRFISHLSTPDLVLQFSRIYEQRLFKGTLSCTVPNATLFYKHRGTPLKFL